MVTTVFKILKHLGYPVSWVKRPRLNDSKPVISYHFFSETPALMGDGASVQDGGKLQVDIFAKADYSKATADVKKALIKAKFRFEESWDDFEELDPSNTLYHKVLIFNYIESEVKA